MDGQQLTLRFSFLLTPLFLATFSVHLLSTHSRSTPSFKLRQLGYPRRRSVTSLPSPLFLLTHSRVQLPRSGVDAESQSAQYNQLYSGKKNTHVNTSFPNVIDVYGRLFSWVLK